ncbi:MAG: pyruvate formate-lyase 1-activating enzyme, partial [Dehalococcoidia bacterium]|nr:pyruvate formate-lyase 1-activating enzyme [Dehalococcoidia bacterium]
QADVMLRYPLIPGRNDGADDLHALCALVRRLPRIPPVELVPYHRLGEHKYRLLGRDYALAGVPPYADDEVNRICESLSASGIACSIVSH